MTQIVGRLGDRTKFFLWLLYCQGNKKQSHQLRVSTVEEGVRGLKTEEKTLKSLMESGNTNQGKDSSTVRWF